MSPSGAGGRAASRPSNRALAATGSLAYLLLVVAVVGPNAEVILAQPGTVWLVAVVALALNVIGYLLGWAARPLPVDHGDRSAMPFTVPKREFSIAAFMVFGCGLAAEVALPSVDDAVVQMLTSPLVARALARCADATSG